MTKLNQNELPKPMKNMISEKNSPGFSHQDDNSIPTKRNSQTRKSLLKRIHTTWIQGLLDPSLADTPYIPLQLKQSFITSSGQWDQEMPAPLLSNTDIVNVFNEARGELLILGEPGSGKTTVLLELLRDLLERAEQDQRHPIPVVFHLSSWSIKCLPLEKWLNHEFEKNYQIDQFQADRSILLLDGLDEVQENVRGACLQAINLYRAAHREVPVVVCCRYNEYVHLHAPTPFRTAVIIQPLNDQQIHTYLFGIEHGQEIVRVLLASNPTLYEIGRNPLLLHMLTQAHEEMDHLDLSATNTAEALQKALFGAHAQHTLARGNSAHRHSLHGQENWLSWLAQRLCWNQQTEFSPEQIHLRWLSTAWQKSIYYTLWIVISLPLTWLLYSLSKGNWSAPPSIDIFASWLVILLFSLLRRRPIHSTAYFIRSRWLLLAVGELVTNLPIGAFFSYIVGIGLLATCVWLSQRLLRRLPAYADQSIRKAGWYAITTGLFSIILLSVSAYADQSIREAGWYAITTGSLFSIILLSLPGVLSHGVSGLFNGLHIALLFGILASLGIGGDAYLEHFILRLILWSAKSIPWRYRSFLNNAVTHKLLYRIGNRYIFRHRLLQDYFASALNPLP